MAEDPGTPPSQPNKPTSPTHPVSENGRGQARQWFAEARETSAKDDAEVKSWKSEMADFGYCPGTSLWDRINWTTDRDFYWRDKVRRQQGKPSRRLWENK